MFKFKTIISTIIITSLIPFFVLFTTDKTEAAITKDVTNSVEFLGNPFNKPTYAENVWDMQVYNNSIYIGHGNSSNEGPATNAGPIDIIKYVPGNKTFENEYTVNEEQIDVFRVINSMLYIPGHDPRDSWEYGNYYFNNLQWNKVRSVPKAIHIYDMAYYNGKLFAACGTDGFSEVCSSSDSGITWKAVTPVSGTFVTSNKRAYKLFEFNGRLYASSIFVNASNCTNNNLLCIDGDSVTKLNINGTQMFPGLSLSYIKLVRTETLNGNLLYLAGRPVNDHQYEPLALYAASYVGVGRKVVFPEAGALPYDLITRAGKAYVLTSIKTAAGYNNIIYSSTDLYNWTEVFCFSSDTFARSFEELDGDFYFGLGCSTSSISNSTGNILKVGREAYVQVNCDIKATITEDKAVKLEWIISPEGLSSLVFEIKRNGITINETEKSSYEDFETIPDTLYEYELIVFNSNKSKVLTTKKVNITTPKDTTPPTTPGIPETFYISETEISFKWNNSTDDTGVKDYTVIINGIESGKTKEPYFLAEDLIPDTEYKVGIIAEDEYGNKSSCSPYLITKTIPDLIKPSVPGGLKPSIVSENSIFIEWQASVDNYKIREYLVYINDEKKSNVTKTSIGYSGFIPGNNYRFKVIAVDYFSNLSDAAQLEISTLKDTVAPAAPSGLAFDNITETSATLTWSSALDNIGVVRYEIYIDGRRLSATSNTKVSYSGFLPGKSYKFSIIAYDASGNASPSSPEITLTTLPDNIAPTAPANLYAESESENDVILSWICSVDNVKVKYYEVFINNIRSTVTTMNRITYKNFTKGASYAFTIYAYDAAGNKSEASNTLIILKK